MNIRVRTLWGFSSVVIANEMDRDNLYIKHGFTPKLKDWEIFYKFNKRGIRIDPRHKFLNKRPSKIETLVTEYNLK